MSNQWESSDVRVDKHAENILQALEDSVGEVLTVNISSVPDGEYALESESIKNLLLVIRRRSITIMDIQARNPGEQAGTNMVQALIEVAEDFGYQLIAENVKPERDEWWRRMGFSPPEGEDHSADYLYSAKKRS